MVNRSRRDQLPQEHKEDRIAHAHGRRNPCDRQHIEGHQRAPEKEVFRGSGELGRGLRVVQQGNCRSAEESHNE